MKALALFFSATDAAGNANAMPISEPNAAARQAIQLERIKIAAARNPVHLVIKTELELEQVVQVLSTVPHVISVEVAQSGPVKPTAATDATVLKKRTK